VKTIEVHSEETRVRGGVPVAGRDWNRVHASNKLSR
jgi:hypothetical protein